MPALKVTTEAEFAERVEEAMMKMANQSKNTLGKDHPMTKWLRDVRRKAGSMAENASDEPLKSTAE